MSKLEEAVGNMLEGIVHDMYRTDENLMDLIDLSRIELGARALDARDSGVKMSEINITTLEGVSDLLYHLKNRIADNQIIGTSVRATCTQKSKHTEILLDYETPKLSDAIVAAIEDNRIVVEINLNTAINIMLMMDRLASIIRYGKM